jgi:hypothetical protein
MRRRTRLGVLGTSLALTALARAQTVVENEVVAPLAGRMYTPTGFEPPSDFYGADLGITVQHEGKLQILFGDTVANGMTGARIGPAANGVPADDASGFICLEQGLPGTACASSWFPTGSVAYLFSKAHPTHHSSIPWDRVGPPIQFYRDFTTHKTLPISLFTPSTNTVLSMGSGETPVAAFSNYPKSVPTPPSRAAVFGIFSRNDFLRCNQGCGAYSCDAGLGTKNVFGVELACVFGEFGCVVSGGLCVDTGSSVYGASASPEGRRLSAVRTLRVGNAPDGIPYEYLHQAWPTNRFSNVTVRTVEAFDSASLSNDYRPADGLSPTANEKVLLWGRPAYVGNTGQGRSAKLYFAYAEMPSYSPSGSFIWNVHYFSGLVNGAPTYSSAPTQAKPLGLNGPGDGTVETWDVVDQMSVAWVAPLKKWVMFYGGDVFPDNRSLVALFGIDTMNTASLNYNALGSIVVRTADNPWGPWSAPKNLFGKDAAEALSQYAAGGVLHNPNCTNSSQCVEHEPFYATQLGYLYGPNIIDTWSVDQTAMLGTTGVDLFWNVSTWDPYQVVLLRTRLTP